MSVLWGFKNIRMLSRNKPAWTEALQTEVIVRVKKNKLESSLSLKWNFKTFLCAHLPAPRKNRSPCLPEYIHKSLRVAGWMAYFLLCSKWMSSLRQQKQQREPAGESKQQIQHKQEGISRFKLAGFVMNPPSIRMHRAQSKGWNAGGSKVGSCTGACTLAEAIYGGLCPTMSNNKCRGMTDTENRAGI